MPRYHQIIRNTQCNIPRQLKAITRPYLCSIERNFTSNETVESQQSMAVPRRQSASHRYSDDASESHIDESRKKGSQSTVFQPTPLSRPIRIYDKISQQSSDASFDDSQTIDPSMDDSVDLSKIQRSDNETRRQRKRRKKMVRQLYRKEIRDTERRGDVSMTELGSLHGIMSNLVDFDPTTQQIINDSDEKQPQFDIVNRRAENIGSVEQFLRESQYPIDFGGLSANLTPQSSLHFPDLGQTTADAATEELTSRAVSTMKVRDFEGILTERQRRKAARKQKQRYLSKNAVERAIAITNAKTEALESAQSAMVATNASASNRQFSVDRYGKPMKTIVPQTTHNSDGSLAQQSDNFDVSLSVWDNQRKIWTHDALDMSPVPKQPMSRQARIAMKRRRHKQLKSIQDLEIVGASPSWLTLAGIDPIILDQLHRRLKTPVRQLAATPKGVYRMPLHLRQAVQDVLISEYWPSGWHEATKDMTFAQRIFTGLPVRYDRRKTLRYIANELPLSVATNYRILSELKHRMPGFKPSAMVDFGMGPGCATLAAMEVFNDGNDNQNPIRAIYGIEPSSVMRDYADTILSDIKQTHHFGWINDLKHSMAKQPLVVSSFVLSEISGGQSALEQILDDLWHATRKVLVIVEAGTMDGFNMINFARSYLLSKYPPSADPQRPGTFTIAPCPHDKQCPLSNDHSCRWIQRLDRHTVPTRCHFRATRDRTKALVSRNKRESELAAHEIHFPFSYTILGKGISPRLISEEARSAASHNAMPHFFMNAMEAEHASYSWPRIISPVGVKHNHLYLNLCLPDTPSHIQQKTNQNRQLLPNNNRNFIYSSPSSSSPSSSSAMPPAIIDNDPTTFNKAAKSGLIYSKVNIPGNKKKPKHVNIAINEGLDASKYGYLERWTVTKADRKLQMYNDAKRSDWGDLWPWPSPLQLRFPPLRKHLRSMDDFSKLVNKDRPIARSKLADFSKLCHTYIRHSRNTSIVGADIDCNAYHDSTPQL